MRLLLRETAEAAAARFWRDAGATSATAAQSVYMSVYRRRWGAEFALQGARMRIARAYGGIASGGSRATTWGSRIRSPQLEVPGGRLLIAGSRRLFGTDTGFGAVNDAVSADS